MELPMSVIVVGLGFGDEGKGATVDALTATGKFDTVVRFNGGQQAGHNVIRNGMHHTFTQVGSGFFNGVVSHTSRFCTFDPISFDQEAAHLHYLTSVDPYQMHSVSPEALLTTPLHVIANHVMEERNHHGTVGVGFGETIKYHLENVADAPTVADLLNPKSLEKKLDKYYEYLRDQEIVTNDLNLEMIAADLLWSSRQLRVREDKSVIGGRTVYEGAQGALLDEWYGFHPNTTWSTTLPDNARELVKQHWFPDETAVIGVTRTYHTRHGAGPMHGEGSFPDAPKEIHNADDGHQGAWRNAAFSAPLFDYAFELVRPEYLSVTHVDVEAPVLNGPYLYAPSTPISDEPARLAEQKRLGKKVADMQDDEVSNHWKAWNVLQAYAPVLLWSDGPDASDRHWHE